MRLVEFSEKNTPDFMDAVRDFLPLAMEHLKLPKLPKIKLVQAVSDTHVPTFGQFNNKDCCIVLDISNRHPVDVLRTLAHELVHFKQEENHQLQSDSWMTGSPQENDANAQAGVIMRHFNLKHPEYLSLTPIILSKSIDDNKTDGNTATTNDLDMLEETYHGDEFYEAYGDIEETLEEATYRGRNVPLNKPMRGDVKKFKVYVKDPKTGNIKKVNFGDPNMRIKKSNPKRRKSFRARHHCENPGPKTKARYWSCRKW